jgi:hypothetical protein
MVSGIRWGLLFVPVLFFCTTAGTHHVRPGRMICVENCSSDGCRKTGDTVWLRAMRDDDTLAVSFTVRPSTGYRWDVVEERNLREINRKIFDSITKSGENPFRMYLSEYAVEITHDFVLRFAFRRGSRDTLPRALCVIMPDALHR